MPRWRVERGLRWLVVGPLGALSAVAYGQLTAGGPVRLVDVIEISEHEEQAVDLTMVFNCAMRFVTNLPASDGREVHIQLVPQPDCRVSPFGPIAAETPPISGGAGVLAGARVESVAPGQITLTLTFHNNERFVLAQGVDPHGLRLRLIDHGRSRGRILVGENEPVSNFAVNLESQPKPFDPEAIERAHERLQAPAFVSEAVVDGEKWYRLRVGPVERRADAERLLDRALAEYPRAWLAIGDDAVTSDLNATMAEVAPPAIARIGSDPALSAEELRKT
ncbi:MAG: SPOR domain-containing protein, partial [Gammaproteobacteria bacterium]|nr:SPOR domain-containing protein [Gammaproteobacteria bacterium]